MYLSTTSSCAHASANAARALLLAAVALPLSIASAQSFTNFEGFTTGVSVDGQGGWGVANPAWDEEVVSFGGAFGNVWRVSNAATAGSFGDMPFAPRPGGIVADATTDPVNGNPGNFAGESGTGAAWTGFRASFDFRSATGAAQTADTRITISPDNGRGARQGFAGIRDNGSTGLELTTFDYNPATSSFDGPILIGSVGYDTWHNVRYELDFIDGPNNDIARIYLDNVLVHSGPSWEGYYPAFEPALHPLGVPVQTLLFRLSGPAEPNALGGGFFIDNVDITLVPAPGAAAVLGLAGLASIRRRR